MEIIHTSQRFTVLVLLLGILPSALGLSFFTPTGAGCVDPQGFLDCYDTQQKQLTQCGQVANSTCSDTNTHLQTCLAGCDGAHLASKVGCWLQSCWNQVYSCEYQRTAIEYLAGVALVPSSVNIPFYPAPPGSLPGGCSCNIGYVYGNLSQTPEYHCWPAANTGNRDILAECTCCQSSFPLSNSWSACPKSDLSLFRIEDDIIKVQRTAGDRTPDKCAVLDHSDSAAYCAEKYGVVEYADKVYNPLNLPSDIPGTEPLSNLPGIAFTTFTSVLTLALDPGYSSTITPVTFNKENAEKTSSGGGGTATGATSIRTGTAPEASSTGGAASSTPKSSGSRLENKLLPIIVGCGIAVLALII